MRVKRSLWVPLLLTTISMALVLVVFFELADATNRSFDIIFGISLCSIIIERFLKTRKYYLSLEDDELIVFEKKHVVHIDPARIEKIQYAGHHMIVTASGIEYDFDLYGYNRLEIEKMLDATRKAYS